MPRALTCLLLLLAGLSGCGDGSGDRGADTGAKTVGGPPPKETPQQVDGIDVRAVGEARDRFVAICKAREGSAAKRDDDELTREMRHSVTIMVRAFRSNPDQPFRRSPGVPAVSMRDRLRAASLVARRSCGGGTGAAQARRMLREVAARDREERAQDDG